MTISHDKKNVFHVNLKQRAIKWHLFHCIQFAGVFQIQHD